MPTDDDSYRDEGSDFGFLAEPKEEIRSNGDDELFSGSTRESPEPDSKSAKENSRPEETKAPQEEVKRSIITRKRRRKNLGF